MNFRKNITKKNLMRYKKHFTHSKTLLDIYKNNDIIPIDLIKLMFYKTKKNLL